jgi:hypothetical protein
MTATMGNDIFKACPKLKSVTISGFTTIGTGLFTNCTALTDVNFNFDNIYGISSSNGSVASQIKTTSIGNYAFDGCTALTSVTLPDGLFKIGTTGFFNNCTALESVYFGKDVSTIAASDFTGCSNLSEIHVKGEDADPNLANSGDNAYNTTYRTIDGVLYKYTTSTLYDVSGNPLNKDEDGKALKTFNPSALVMYPAGKTDKVYNVPNTVSSIPKNAFEEHKYIEELIIDPIATSTSKTGTASKPKMTIADSAFLNCQSLKSVKIYNECTISKSAFQNCTNLTNLEHYAEGGSIGNYAFAGSGLEVTELYGWDTISANAFNGCTSLTNLTLGPTVGTVGASAFKGCTGLESVDLSNLAKNSTKTITFGTGVFEGCSSLTSAVMPDCLDSLSSSTFKDCTSLTDVTLGDETAVISSNAFSGCTALQKFVGNRFLVQIDANAFNGCTSLEELEVTRCLKVINAKAFNGCTALARISAPKKSTAYKYAEDNNLEQNAIENTIYDSDFFIYGTENLGSDLSKEELAKYGDFVSQDDSGNYQLSIISGYRGGFSRLTFKYAETPFIGKSFISQAAKVSMKTYLEAVDINTDNTGYGGVGASAFSGCTNMNTVALSDDISYIGDYAFNGCTGINSYSRWAMEDDRVGEFLADSSGNGSGSGSGETSDGLTIVLPASCTSVGANAFAGCTSIVKVDLSNLNGSIGDRAFYNCSNLETVIIGDGVTTIGTEAFAGCKALVNLDMGNGVSSIGDKAFKDCTSLESVTISKNMLSLSSGIFSGCTSLNDVILNANLDRIYSNAFENCTSLETIILNDGLFLDENAFAGCTSLKTIVIPPTVNLSSLNNPFPDIPEDASIYCASDSNDAGFTNMALTFANAQGITTQDTEFTYNGNTARFTPTVTIKNNSAYVSVNGAPVISGSTVDVGDRLVILANTKPVNNETTVIYVNGKKIEADSDSATVIYTASGNDVSIVIYAVSFELGDVDENGTPFEGSDAALTLKFISGAATPTDKQLKSADVNEDNKIDLTDAISLLNHN